jgi:long-subunit acyl-CoA synthetase (AMP-forming)
MLTSQKVLIDAADTTRSLSSNQARKTIRQLVAGFRAAGLKKGDCVCIHSFNDIYYPILVNAIIAAGGNVRSHLTGMTEP